MFICDTKWPNRVGLWGCVIVLLTQCADNTQQQGRFMGLSDSPAHTLCRQTEHHTRVQAHVAKTVVGMVRNCIFCANDDVVEAHAMCYVWIH